MNRILKLLSGMPADITCISVILRLMLGAQITVVEAVVEDACVRFGVADGMNQMILCLCARG